MITVDQFPNHLSWGIGFSRAAGAEFSKIMHWYRFSDRKMCQFGASLFNINSGRGFSRAAGAKFLKMKALVSIFLQETASVC